MERELKMANKESPEALKWWSELSMNEQEKYRMEHPFFSQMGKDYFNTHATSITQVYEHYLKQNGNRKE